MDEMNLTLQELELLQSAPVETKGEAREPRDDGAPTAGDLGDVDALDIRRQLEVLEAFHQGVAERFADALSRGLQRLVEVRLTDVQAMAYSQFAFSRSKPTCYLVLQATPLPASLALDLSPGLLYPMLDSLLGGGKHVCPLPQRAPTELEQRLARRVVRLLLDELHDAWEPLLAVDLSIDRVESDAQRVRVVAPGEEVVVLNFTARVTEQSGVFSLCLPQRAIRKIVDKLLVGELAGSEATALSSVHAATETVELVAHFDAEPLSRIELDQLREGDVLLTDLDADGWVQLSVDGRPAFQARPGTLDGRRAVVLGPPLSSESV
jgi:flagellar motor switch protein FliM